MRSVFRAVFWAVMILAPLVITACVLGSLPEGIEQVPMQVGFDGEVNRWGSPSEFWIVGGVMSGVNALMALCYRFNDQLYNLGLVHGVSRKGALVFYDVLALFIVGVTAGVEWFLLSLV